MAGDEVAVGERSAEWPEFVFVRAEAGSGWVPARYHAGRGGRAEAVSPYDATGLATEAGETLEVLDGDLLSGWLWCRDGEGAEGWVPIATLTPIAT